MVALSNLLHIPLQTFSSIPPVEWSDLVDCHLPCTCCGHREQDTWLCSGLCLLIHFIYVVCGDDCTFSLMWQARSATSPVCGPKWSHLFSFIVSAKGGTFFLLPCKVSAQFVTSDFRNHAKSGELELLCIQRVWLQCRRSCTNFMTVVTVLSVSAFTNWFCDCIPCQM